MIATSFNESNVALGAPPGMEKDCDALSVWRGLTQGGQPVVISCWKLTKEELEEINKTGRVWLWVHGLTMPPVSLEVSHPFKET